MNKTQKTYFLYIDDSGSRFPDKKPEARTDGMDQFALGGVLMLESDKQEVKEKYLEFCKKWDINYPLHSSEIRSMRENFIWLESSAKQREKFLEELETLLLSFPVLGFAAVIHRPGYNKRYREKYKGKPWLMCKTAYSILIERASRYVDEQNGVLRLRFEAAGKREDRAFMTYAKSLKQTGMPFNKDTSAKYTALTKEDFERIIISEPRRKDKNNLYTQIADLYLYPMAKRQYEPTYNPWVKFYENKKVIDSLLPEEDWPYKGIKYSCFDDF